MRRDAVIRMEAGKTLTIGSRVSTNHEPDMFRVDIELPESAPLFRPEPVEVSCSVKIDWQLV